MSLRSELIKEKRLGKKIYTFGTRLKLEGKPDKGGFTYPEVTKHLSDDEYDSIKDLLDGVDEARD